MNLNLLLNINDFQWKNISHDYSSCLESFGELLVTLIDEEDNCWHHPDIYNLTYSWGSVHDFIFTFDYPTVRQLTGGWMKQRHFATFKNLWKFCKDQRSPFCRTLEELNAHPKHCNELNGLLACASPNMYHVNSSSARHDLLIYYYRSNNARIDWHAKNHPFLPNIIYSNLYLAEKLRKDFDADLTEKRKQIEKYAKEYCDDGYILFLQGGAKEAHAEEVGSEIARRNFYIFEEELSKEEHRIRGSLRKIFSIYKYGVKQYLSIDFEKSNCFELCNFRGEHQGEFRFDGIENGKDGSTKDSSGNHDLWALR